MSVHTCGSSPGSISARASSQSVMRGAEAKVVAQVRPGGGNVVGVEDCGIAAASAGAAVHFWSISNLSPL